MEKVENNIQRNSNIELLRIICMLFIIGGHIIKFGFKMDYDHLLPFGGFDYIVQHILYGIFVIAVNVFVLISGYFGIKLNFGKLLRIESLVLCYSIPFFLILLFTHHGIIGSISYLFPTLSSEFWFVSTYMVLCLVAPFLNALVKRLNKIQLRALLVGLYCVFYIWATFCYALNLRQLQGDFGGGIVNFSILYLTGRYIKIYYTKKRSFQFFFFSFIAVMLLMDGIETLYGTLLGFPFTAFQNLNTIFIVVASILFLLAFNSCIFYSSFVNKLAKNSFAVYIIHFNKIVMPCIGSIALTLKYEYHIPIFGIVCILPIFIYLISIFIEQLRKIIISKFEDNVCNVIDQEVQKITWLRYPL